MTDDGDHLADLLTAMDDVVARMQDGRDGGAVPPLTEDQASELARCLDLDADAETAAVLSAAVTRAARNLIGFFTAGSGDGRHEAERREELRRIAADPARALLTEPISAGGKSARDILETIAEASGIDATTTRGAAVIGDIAAGMLTQKKRRADADLMLGEDQLFDDAITIIGRIAPASLAALPANEWGADRHPAVAFAMEFVVQVVDRALAVVPASDKRACDRLLRLKGKSPRAILDALREPRRSLHEHEPPNGYSD